MQLFGFELCMQITSILALAGEKKNGKLFLKYKFLYFSTNRTYHGKCQIVTIYYDNRVRPILPTYSKFTAWMIRALGPQTKLKYVLIKKFKGDKSG